MCVPREQTGRRVDESIVVMDMRGLDSRFLWKPSRSIFMANVLPLPLVHYDHCFLGNKTIKVLSLG